MNWNKFLTQEYYDSIAGAIREKQKTGSPGDAPLEERFRAAMVKSLDPDFISMNIPGGKMPEKKAVYVDSGATLTNEGLKVTGDRGIEYDARALVFNWNGRCDYEMTIEFWHKYEDGGRLLTVGRYDGGGRPGADTKAVYQVIYIATDKKGARICFDRRHDTGNVAGADFAFDKDKWYHFALVCDPNISNPLGTKSDGITRLYINGNEVITANIKGEVNPDWADDAVIRIGGSPDDDVGLDTDPDKKIPAGHGRGIYSGLVITRGLKYRRDFTPPARPGEGAGKKS
jgi:hypothetical protein